MTDLHPGVPEGGLRLDELAREIPGRADVRGAAATRVTGVSQDSRRVARGDLFVARRGARVDGARFVEDACRRGAAAVLSSDPEALAAAATADVPAIAVDDVAVGLAWAAAAVYGHPAFSLEIVGITGTNGKTTTAHLVQSAVDGVFERPVCGLIGTVGHRFGELALPAEHTTPEADEIARVMARFRAAGATHVAMEASSIALALGRTLGVRFRVAAFTNLTQDHLDFHGSMEAYAEAKAALFTAAGPGVAVINVADPFGRVLAGRVASPLVRVSPRADDAAEIAPLRATFDRRGIEATLRTPAGEVALTSRLFGAHNLENLVVALGVAHALDIDVRRAAAALGPALGAPGRLERCDGTGDDVVALVDYAHTPDALAKALAAVRAVAGSGRVICVFGCGGDRDPSKRAPMGEAVAQGADLAVVTTDNPRTEDPRAITDAIEEGMRGAHYVVELDRARAIASAVAMARPDDVVLIAGKGHENYQIIGAEKRPFDDRVEARRALAVRRETRSSGGA